MSQERRPTFFQSLAAGGAAGTTVDILFFPIDTVKTRLQSAQGFAKAGGFSGIYKGIGIVVVGSAPGAAVFFSVYDTMKQNLPISAEPVKHIVAASMGEVAACLIRVPTEVIKTRTQTSSYGGQNASSLAAARILLQTEGLKGYYRGFGITIMREIPFTSIQFPIYEWLKKRISVLKNPENPVPLPPIHAAACGSVAGGFAAAVTTPLDVIKTRVMLDLKTAESSKRPTFATRFMTIYSTEGPKALFAGVVPRTMWISAGGAVFLGAYEFVISNMV